MTRRGSDPTASSAPAPDVPGHDARPAEGTDQAAERSTWRAIIDGNVGQFAAQALAVLRVLLVARLLSPDVLGAYAALVLVFTYGANIHLGLFDGTLRHVPRLRGEGRANEARHLQDTAFTGTMGLALFLLLGATAFAASAPGLTPPWRAGLILVALAVLLQQAFNFISLQDRIRMRFDRVRTSTILRSIVEFAVAVGLAQRLQLLALPLSLAAGLAVAILWLAPGMPDRYRLRFSAAMARSALAFGTPVLVGGLGLTVLMSLDRLLILHYLDVRRMGYYVLGAQLGSVIYLFPTAVASVLYIRFLALYGQNRGDASGLYARAREALHGTGLLAALLTGGGLALTTLLSVLLPDFAPGMDAVRIALVGFGIISISSMASNLLVAMDRTRWMLMAQGSALAMLGGVGVVAGTIGGTLVAVAAAVAVGFTVYTTLLLAGVDARCTGHLHPMGWLRTYLPLGVVAGASAVVHQIAPPPSDLLVAGSVTLVHGAVVVALLIPLALPVILPRWRARRSSRQRPDAPTEDP